MKKCKHCGTTKNLVTRKFKNQNMSKAKIITQNLCYDCRFKIFSKAQKGKVISEETKQKLSKAVTEWHQTKEGRKKHSIGQKKRYQREEERIISSINGKKLWKNPEYRKKKQEQAVAQWNDPIFRKNKSEQHSQFMKDQWQNEAYREKMSNMSKTQWEDEEYKKEMSRKHKERLKGKNPFKANGLKPTKPQQELYEKVKMFFPDAKDNFTVVTAESRRYPDIFIPCLNLIVEYDGSYWHDEETDKKRDDELVEAGYKILHFVDNVPHELQVFGQIRKSVILKEQVVYT